MFWAASALVSQVQSVPGQWLARLIALVWMFGGVAFYTAQPTSTLTVQQMRGAIQGPADLAGKQVGTIANSVAVAYLQAHHAQVQKFVTPDLMYKALLEGRVNAGVFGAPVLLYYASHQGSGLVRVVGPQFNTLPVAMFFPAESPLRKRVDTALTALRENGTYQRLYDKWFGSE